MFAFIYLVFQAKRCLLGGADIRVPEGRFSRAHEQRSDRDASGRQALARLDDRFLQKRILWHVGALAVTAAVLARRDGLACGLPQLDALRLGEAPEAFHAYAVG